MLNKIGYGRISGKDSGVNSLDTAAEGIRCTVTLDIGPLLM